LKEARDIVDWTLDGPPQILVQMVILYLICIICSYFNVTSPGH